MADVIKVTTVVPDCFKKASELPIEKLASEIKSVRQYFFDGVEQDCRGAQDFIDDWQGKGLYRHFCESWDEFCIAHIGRSSEWIQHIADGVQLLGHSKPITADEAIKAVALKDSRQPDRVRQTSPETIAKAERARELREQGLIQSQIAEELGVPQSYVSALLNSDISNTWYIVPCVTDINDQSDRPAARGNLREYMIARLDRDAPEIAAKVRSGEISAHKGMIEAGIRKRKVNANWNDGASPNEIADVLMRKIPSEHLASVVAALTNQLVQ